MSPRPTTSRYGAATIGLHWLMLLLLAAVYATIELRGWFPKGSDPREAMKAWHFMLGLSALGLVALRLLARTTGERPAIVPEPPRWQQRLATAMHLLLYGWMVAMPLLGWLTLSAAGKPVPFFGLELPPLLAQSKDLAGGLKEVHEVLGTLGYFLIGGHALAAVFHHHVARDNTLRLMLPGRS
jgi:superoxide oxidase